MVDTATRRSSSTSRRDRYLFFMYVTAEKNCSHKYVDPNGSSTSIAARDNSVYSSATAKIQAVWNWKIKFLMFDHWTAPAKHLPDLWGDES